MLSKRLVDLDKEIEQHLISWKKDQCFKTLPKDLQKKVKQFIEYFSLIRNSDGTLPLFEIEEKEDPQKKNFKLFLYLFNKHYKDVCGMECLQKLNGVHVKIYQTQVNKIVEQGVDLNMYVEWVFHDFLQEKANQKFMPPTIKFVLGTFLFSKFMFNNKDAILKKKKEELVMSQKQKFNEVLIDIYKQTGISQFGVIVRKFTANEFTLTKAIVQAKQLCSMHNCMQFIEKIQQIKDKKS